MKRVHAKKNGRPARAGGKVKPKAAPGAAKKTAPAGKAVSAADSGLVAAMEQHRDLPQIQNEELGKAHAALEISRQRIAELHEQGPVGYLTFDPQGCIRAVNAEAAKLLGIERRTVIGKPFVVFVEKADRKKFLDHLWKIRRSPDRVATELRLVSKDGTLRQVRMSTGRHQDSAGQSALFLCAVEDVGELRAASIGAANLAAIVQNSPDAIMRLSLDGIFQSWNPGAERLFGYTRDEMIGRPVSVLVPPDRSEELTPIVKMARGGVAPPPFETVRLRKDGTRVDVEILISPILESGRVIATTGVLRDITERKAAAERLRRKAELLALAQEGARMGVFEWDLVTNRAVWMPEMEELMGMKLEDRPDNLAVWFAEIHPEDQSRLVETLQAWAISDRQDATVQYRFSPNGEVRWFELRGRIMRDAGGAPLRMIATNLDITERRKMEDALRESQRLARATVEAIPAHIAIIDDAGTILETNTAWRRFATENRGSDESTGRGVNYLKVCDKVHGMERREARRFAAGIRAVLGGRSELFTMDYACHSPTERRWFASYVTPVAGPGARKAVVAHVNITAVKLAEEKFRGVVESAPDAMVITDGGGTIRSVNTQAERLFGYRRRELIGRKAETLMPPASRRAHVSKHADYSIAPTNRPMGRGASFPARRKDGSEFPAEIGLSPLQTHEGLMVCSVIRDITDRKKAEDALRASEERLRLFVENTPAPVAMFDPEMRYLVVSKRWAEAFRLPATDLVGRSHYEVFPETPGRWKKIHRRCLAGATERRERDRFPRADGTVDWVQWEIHPWRNERGEIGGLIIFAEVINDRVKAEEEIRALNTELEERVAARTAALREANAERRRLEQEVLEISESERRSIGQDLHDDLGQQLAGLWFFTSTLEHSLRAENSPQADTAAKIAGQLDKALALTRSLARGLQPVAAEPGGLVAALGELAERSSELFKLRCRIVCRSPVEVRDPATATHLYRIAQEAVTNAARHGRARHISILLSAASGKLTLTVSDDGRGVKQPSFQRNGMGIRTMNYRAEALAGSLEFRDRPRGGTIVICKIPLPAATPKTLT
jgi:PAS domain S-box-containing protein